MPFLLAILGALGIAAIWWYRLKYLSEAANEAADAIGRVQGHFRRKELRKKAALSPISAINDPVVAAVTVITAIAAENVPVSKALEERIRAEAREIAASKKKLDEAVIYAKWSTDQVADVPTVIDQTAKFLTSRLDESEKEDLLQMLDRVVLRGERQAEYPLPCPAAAAGARPGGL
ncbi:hypothetical protein M2281_002019 [Mesorhizobium soli]|uniref:hypothetical protein n=1 Tax=Pseudaminobacter soli (ex Li et al. 2025) TaxID=1295366 RepID=UPI002474E208|nr:hypothetical protein [Mesorhizobium soli]MDH6231447.1 hypothetical protein [Mesorhizobium soli]